MYIDIKDSEDYVIIQKEYTDTNRLKKVSLVTNPNDYKGTYAYLHNLYINANEESVMLVDGLYRTVDIKQVRLYTDANYLEIVKPIGFVVYQIVKI